MLCIPCPPSISSAGRMACATETLHVEKCGILWKCVERAVWKTSGCSACFYSLRVSRTPERAARVRLARKQKGGSRRGCPNLNKLRNLVACPLYFLKRIFQTLCQISCDLFRAVAFCFRNTSNTVPKIRSSVLTFPKTVHGGTPFDCEYRKVHAKNKRRNVFRPPLIE